MKEKVWIDMSKSIFRFVDRFELLSCYMLCFVFNILFNYVKTLSINSHLLENFLKQFYDYQMYIVFLLTFTVVIFHYQILQRKIKEVYCRFIVGDTIKSIIIRYILECLVILAIAFTLSMIISIILKVRFNNNIYLAFCLIVYIFISSKGVRKI